MEYRLGLMILVMMNVGYMNFAYAQNGILKLTGNPQGGISGGDIALMHWEGGTEGHDPILEAMYPYGLYIPPVIDFYWATPFPYPSDKLVQEARAPESMTTFTGIMDGRSLPGGEAVAKLGFEYFIPGVLAFVPDNYINKKPILDLAQRVNIGTPQEPNYVYQSLGSFDIDILISTGIQIPLTVKNGITISGTFYPSHHVNVRFIHRAKWVKEDCNFDGIVDGRDFAKFAVFWFSVALDYSDKPAQLAQFYSVDLNEDDVIDLMDLEEFCSYWLSGI